MQQISQRRLMLALQAQSVINNQSAQAQLQALDKALELQLKTCETQEKAVTTEVDSVKKIIDQNIEKSFKYMG